MEYYENYKTLVANLFLVGNLLLLKNRVCSKYQNELLHYYGQFSVVPPWILFPKLGFLKRGFYLVAHAQLKDL